MNRLTIDEKRYRGYDVLVAGGGVAGIVAAIASARPGARTLLVERAGWLGGLGITGATGLHSFFNIYGAHEGVDRMRVAGGIPQQLVDSVQAMGGGVGHVQMEQGADFVSMLTPVEPETFKYAAARMCIDAGVDLLLHSVVDEVHATDGHIEGVVVWNKAGRSLIRAKQYVDCTGDGDLAGYAGAEFASFSAGDLGAYGAGFTFRLCNIDLQALEADLTRQDRIGQLAHAVKPGMDRPDLVRLGARLRDLHEQGVEGAPPGLLATSVRPRELTYCNCINYGPNDGLDPDALTRAEVDLRGRMLGVADFFRRHFDGCGECYAAGAAPAAGQRRGRAIRTAYELTIEDCTSARQFDDQVGCFSFIDKAEFLVRDGGAYGIPYRALLPNGVDNALIAGRMMTYDREAQNSTRLTVCCMISGQAAGTAAALSALDGNAPAKLDAEQVQSALVADGVLLRPEPA